MFVMPAMVPAGVDSVAVIIFEFRRPGMGESRTRPVLPGGAEQPVSHPVPRPETQPRPSETTGQVFSEAPAGLIPLEWWH